MINTLVAMSYEDPWRLELHNEPFIYVSIKLGAKFVAKASVTQSHSPSFKTHTTQIQDDQFEHGVLR